MKNFKKAFTLLEMLIVAMVMAILMGIIFPSIKSCIQKKTSDTQDK